jgi:hypothetical protein
MNHRLLVRVGVLSSFSALAPALLVAACGSSDSQVPGGGGNGSSGSSSSSSSSGSTGSSGSSSSGGSTGSSSGGSSNSSSSSGSSSGAPGDGGTCPAQTSLTRAVKITLPVTWPQQPSTGSAQSATTLGGSGNAYVWLLDQYPTVSGNTLTGSTQTCKLQLPDVSLGSLIGVLLGGTKVQIQIPPTVWAKVPVTAVVATQTGWSPPSTFNTNAPIDLVGIRFPSGTDPAVAWPMTPSGFPPNTMFPDDDMDGHIGITGTPLGTNGYVLPPTDSVASAKADQVYIASRNQFVLNGAWSGSACTDQSGTATAMLFDNHVVGCHVSGGSDCITGSGSQAAFIDTNRTVYAPQSGGTFSAKILPSSATCADAITALP